MHCSDGISRRMYFNTLASSAHFIILFVSFYYFDTSREDMELQLKSMTRSVAAEFCLLHIERAREYSSSIDLRSAYCKLSFDSQREQCKQYVCGFVCVCARVAPSSSGILHIALLQPECSERALSPQTQRPNSLTVFMLEVLRLNAIVICSQCCMEFARTINNAAPVCSAE